MNPHQLPLFGPGILPARPGSAGHRRLVAVLRLNPHIRTILERLPDLPVEPCWLTSGCIAQTIWNLRAGRPPEAGIADYDLIYLDADTSWEAENQIVQDADRLFADLPIRIEIRNQARVPLWYRDKFEIDFPRVREARNAVRYFPSRSTAIAVTVRATGDLECFSPYGLRDLHRDQVRPNPKLSIESVYRGKVARWISEWPQLTAWPW